MCNDIYILVGIMCHSLLFFMSMFEWYLLFSTLDDIKKILNIKEIIFSR